LVPVCRFVGLPSFIITIVALATICSGAAVFTFGRKATSLVGTSSVGKANAAELLMSSAMIDAS
jgi:hypothetical protein